MDALALLCNLHADGPSTLERLRQAGCRQLVDLQQLEPRELAQILDAAEARAARFLREARLLGDRVGGEPERERADQLAPRRAVVSVVEPELVVESESEHERERGRGRERERARASEHEPESEPEVVLTPVANRRDHYALRPIKDAVLDVWRERDSIDPPLARPTPAELAPSVHIPEPLTVGCVDGLDARALDVLRRAGVRGLRELVDADATALARTTGLPYSALRRWQFLAARVASQAAPPAAARAPRVPGSGGPFAL